MKVKKESGEFKVKITPPSGHKMNFETIPDDTDGSFVKVEISDGA